MSFCIIAIDNGSEKQEVCPNILGATEFVDYAKGDGVANVKSVTGSLDAHAVILLAVNTKPFPQAAEVNIFWNYLDLKNELKS